MKSLQRLVLMMAGLLVICSSNFVWLNNVRPVDVSFGYVLSSAIHGLSGGSIVFSIDLLNRLSMAVVAFTVGVVIMVAVALGSKAVSLLGLLLIVATIALWSISYNLDFTNLLAKFGQLGFGTQLAAVGGILIIIALVLPKIKLPHKTNADS